MSRTSLATVVAVGTLVAGGCSALGGTRRVLDGKRRVTDSWVKAEILNGRRTVRILLLDDPPDIRVDEAQFKRRGHRILLSLLAPSPPSGIYATDPVRQCVDVRFPSVLPFHVRLVDVAKPPLSPAAARKRRSDRLQNPGPIRGPCRKVMAHG